jgi:hypothetical protein
MNIDYSVVDNVLTGSSFYVPKKTLPQTPKIYLSIIDFILKAFNPSTTEFFRLHFQTYAEGLKTLETRFCVCSSLKG